MYIYMFISLCYRCISTYNYSTEEFFFLVINMHQCQYCEKQFATVGNLNRHTQTMHSKASTRVYCAYCGHPFESGRMDSARRHSLRAHPGSVVQVLRSTGAPRICPFCMESFQYRGSAMDNFVAHVKACPMNPVHSKNSNKYVCGICKKSFSKSYNLKLHTKRFHTEWSDLQSGGNSLNDEDLNMKIESLLNKTLDVNLLIMRTHTEVVLSPRFQAEEHKTSFLFTDLSRNLCSQGYQLEVITMVLNHLLQTQRLEKVYALAVSLDQPSTLESPISSPFSLVENFSIEKFLYQVSFGGTK